MPDTDKPPRCNACQHYYITHDIHFRYGCRALAFKSRRQPIFEVVAASGQPCQFFALKSRMAAED